MKENRKSIVSLRMPLFVIEILKKESEKRKISTGEYASLAFYEFFKNHENLDKKEMLFVLTAEKAQKAGMIEFLRSQNMKKISIIDNVYRMIQRIRQGTQWIEKKDLLENLKFTIDICDIYGWKFQKKKIKEWIYDLRKVMLNEKKMGIKVTNVPELDELKKIFGNENE